MSWRTENGESQNPVHVALSVAPENGVKTEDPKIIVLFRVAHSV